MLLSKHARFLIWLSGIIVIFLSACGGGSGDSLLNGETSATGTATNEVTRTTGLLITESEITTLPVWQQELLGDSGWNSPYFAPLPETELPVPTGEMLMEYSQAVRTQDLEIVPRISTESRGASWMNQGGFDGIEQVFQGEYDGIARDATPPYGCNNDATNGANDNALEDVIRVTPKYLPQTVSYVLEGLSSPNWFNTIGGATNSAQSAVYQLFSDLRLC